MRGQRMWQTLRLYTILNAVKRTQYYKKKKIFHSMGDNCLVMDRKVPLYAKLISLGNNVQIASNVHFNTHDITHRMLNNMDWVLARQKGEKYLEKMGCIEIGDNVFIGSGTSINYNVRIGSNVIIGAFSLITKDIPDNCVVAGVPVRVISSFEEYLEKRNSVLGKDILIDAEYLSSDLEISCWRQFKNERKRN